jgi:hypothetical protein
LRLLSAGLSDRSGTKDEQDMGLLSPENFKFAVDAEVVVAVVEALKHFWHMLFVAGLPVTPQLFTHRVMVSGTLNSVSSFSVL